jgi:hypothetical protein
VSIQVPLKCKAKNVNAVLPTANVARAFLSDEIGCARDKTRAETKKVKSIYVRILVWSNDNQQQKEIRSTEENQIIVRQLTIIE